MTTNAPNPSPATPDAAELLAYVEGELDVAGELRLRRSLRHAPEVLARLDAMRRDRGTLRAAMLGDPVLPRSLAARVDESLAREALIAAPRGRRVAGEALSLAGVAEPALAPPPRSPNPWRSTQVVTALSMAAAVALVAGGLVLTLRPAGPSPDGSSRLPSPIAAVERASDAGGVGQPSRADSGEALALASPSGPEVAADAALPDASGVEVPFDLAGASGPALPESTRLLPGVVARGEVLALAEQQRLALRIASDEPREVVAAIEQAVERSRAGGLERAPWRVRHDAPPALAGAIGLTLHSFDETPGPSASPGAPIFEELASLPPPDDQPIAESDRWLLRQTDEALAVYLAEVDLTEAAIEAFKRELARESDPLAFSPDMFRDAAPIDAGFAALADPIDRVLGHTTLLVPADDVIWWYQPPRRWAKRTLVPVIVERRE